MSAVGWLALLALIVLAYNAVLRVQEANWRIDADIESLRSLPGGNK